MRGRRPRGDRCLVLPRHRQLAARDRVVRRRRRRTGRPAGRVGPTRFRGLHRPTGTHDPRRRSRHPRCGRAPRRRRRPARRPVRRRLPRAGPRRGRWPPRAGRRRCQPGAAVGPGRPRHPARAGVAVHAAGPGTAQGLRRRRRGDAVPRPGKGRRAARDGADARPGPGRRRGFAPAGGRGSLPRGRRRGRSPAASLHHRGAGHLEPAVGRPARPVRHAGRRVHRRQRPVPAVRRAASPRRGDAARLPRAATCPASCRR